MRTNVIRLAAAAALSVGTIAVSPAMAQMRTGSSGNIGQAGQNDPSVNSQSGSMSEGNLHQIIQQANTGDKLFIVEAALDNQCEIKLGQLAQQKAQDSQVKQAAQRIVQDHQQAQQQLQTVAQEVGIQLPQGTPMLKQQEFQNMQSLSGKEFDQCYVSHMRAGHAKDISKFQDVAQLSKSDQVRQYAQKQLPALREHDRLIEQAAVALGLPSNNEAQPAGARMPGAINGTRTGGSSDMTGSSDISGTGSTPRTSPEPGAPNSASGNMSNTNGR
ncbi:MAG TPA: DUF4142 domain-containing protein [Tepidisphaeraceae bacterium]|nr:DUF4142 domain-containing protein [Tepidisphaeraceae bacterium]